MGGIRTELLRRWFEQKSVAPDEVCEYIVNTWNNMSKPREEGPHPLRNVTYYLKNYRKVAF